MEQKRMDCFVACDRSSNRMLLCIFTDNTERQELKTFFETNCSQIYFIFYENFVTLESNLKQKGEFCVNRLPKVGLLCCQQLDCFCCMLRLEV